MVPNFNHAQFLPMALDSILSQTVLPHEVIMIDDGSTDNSKEIMLNYVSNSPIFKLHDNKKNIGAVKSINNVLGLLTGTHVLFLASDDWLLPNLIATAYSMLQQYPNAGLWSSGSWIAYEDRIEKLYPLLVLYPIRKSGFITSDKAKELIFKQDSWFAGNTVIHNLKIFKAENGFDPELRSFADGFLYRTIAAKYGCCFAAERLGVWRIRKESYSQVSSKQVDALVAITAATRAKIEQNYTNLFSERLSRRINQRLTFMIAKAIWEQSNFKFTITMQKLLQQNQPSILNYVCSVFLLRLISILPVGRRESGGIILLTYFKVFDIINILKSRIIQKLEIA